MAGIEREFRRDPGMCDWQERPLLTMLNKARAPTRPHAPRPASLPLLLASPRLGTPFSRCNLFSLPTGAPRRSVALALLHLPSSRRCSLLTSRILPPARRVRQAYEELKLQDFPGPAPPPPRAANAP